MAAHQGRRTISTLNLCGGAAKRALYVDPSGLFSEKCFWAYNALMFILPSSLSTVVFGLIKIALVHCICPDMDVGKFFILVRHCLVACCNFYCNCINHSM